VRRAAGFLLSPVRSCAGCLVWLLLALAVVYVVGLLAGTP